MPRSHLPVRETVLLELFTSQGCSSCPQADALLRDLLRDPELGPLIVPLALHVDYWNGLGWQDPFSDKRWSARQRVYATLRGSRQVATPGAVIDGYRAVPAARADLLRAAIRKLSRQRHSGRIEIAVQDAQMAARVSINAYLRRGVNGRRVDVVVALYEDGVMTQVMSGENNGRELRNDRVVRYMQVVDRISPIGGSLSRKSIFVPLPANWKGRRFGIVAFLQARPSMRVHGTAVVHFGYKGDIPSQYIKRPAHKPRSILYQPL